MQRRQDALDEDDSPSSLAPFLHFSDDELTSEDEDALIVAKERDSELKPDITELNSHPQFPPRTTSPKPTLYVPTVGQVARLPPSRERGGRRRRSPAPKTAPAPVVNNPTAQSETAIVSDKLIPDASTISVEFSSPDAPIVKKRRKKKAFEKSTLKEAQGAGKESLSTKKKNPEAAPQHSQTQTPVRKEADDNTRMGQGSNRGKRGKGPAGPGRGRNSPVIIQNRKRLPLPSSGIQSDQIESLSFSSGGGDYQAHTELSKPRRYTSQHEASIFASSETLFPDEPLSSFNFGSQPKSPFAVISPFSPTAPYPSTLSTSHTRMQGASELPALSPSSVLAKEFVPSGYGYQ